MEKLDWQCLCCSAAPPEAQGSRSVIGLVERLKPLAGKLVLLAPALCQPDFRLRWLVRSLAAEPLPVALRRFATAVKGSPPPTLVFVPA